MLREYVEANFERFWAIIGLNRRKIAIQNKHYLRKIQRQVRIFIDGYERKNMAGKTDILGNAYNYQKIV